jgi:hypothetical protein
VEAAGQRVGRQLALLMDTVGSTMGVAVVFWCFVD